MTDGLTSQQRSAIYTHDRHVVVVAGAGSGKTHVLVERFLALLDQNRDWPLNALVAITFTRKAAGEMRDRLRQRLAHNLNTATDADEAAHWSRLLGQVDSARVTTIHGLCADVLRANAAEAGIDPEFDVIEEVDAAILLNDVALAVLEYLGAADAPESALFAEYRRGDILNVVQNPDLLAACRGFVPDDWSTHWENQWEMLLRQGAARFLRTVDEIGVLTLDELPQNDDKLGDAWRICLAALNDIRQGDAKTIYNRLKEIGGLKTNVGSNANWPDVKAAQQQLKKIKEASTGTVIDPPDDLDARAAVLMPVWISLLRKVHRVYQAEKAHRNQLDFNDLERMACELLDSNPHVAARYQGREFQHLLVDEFQDTNAQQWRIIQALAGTERRGSMFVVGDPKQSIYAFRGADVSVFEHVRDQVRGMGGEEIPLSTSFRSHRPLIDCFNGLFSKVLVKDRTSPVIDYQIELGEPLHAHREQPPSGGPHMEVMLIPKHDYDASGEVLCDERGEAITLGAPERRAWEAHEIARRLQAMIAEGRRVHDKETDSLRPMGYGDVAILFQAMTSVTIYEDAFKAAGLPFVTFAGRGYYDRQEVWDLRNLLQVLYNPRDDLALASVLRSPLFGLSDDALLALRLTTAADGYTPLPLWTALAAPGHFFPADEEPQLSFARSTLAMLRADAGRVTISELLRRALERTGYLAVLAGLPDGARRRGNVEKLVEKAQASGKVTLGAFTAFLQNLGAQVAREGEAPVEAGEAVSLMTLYASKGLEFPVVVLADASWAGGSSGNPLVVRDVAVGFGCKTYDEEEARYKDSFASHYVHHLDKLRQEAESLRKLYVAMTRARDYVLICGQANMTSKGAWTARGWLKLLLDTLEIPADLIPGSNTHIAHSAHPYRLIIPRQRPASPVAEISKEALPDTLLPVGDVAPGLLRPLRIQREAQARHLAASHIADLGSVPYTHDPERDFFRERFRRQVFQDAPATVEIISRPRQGVTARQIGEIVHEALQHWHLPGEVDDVPLRALLANYAWRRNITDEHDIEQAVIRAYDLLQRFRESALYKQIKWADQVYRELPFVYARDGHIIHGIIDVLYHMSGMGWMLCDYKTSYVRSRDESLPPDHGELYEHSRRYHLQVGIYAAAVAEQIGSAPRVAIHYVQHTQFVTIAEDDWRAAIQHTLPSRISEIIQETRL